MEDHMSGNSAPSSGGAAGLTAKMLAARAAAAALSGQAVSPGQWVYRNYVVVATPANAANPVTVERWATADNAAAAATWSTVLAGCEGAVIWLGSSKAPAMIDHRRYHGRYRRGIVDRLDQPHLASWQLARACALVPSLPAQAPVARLEV